MTHRYLLFDSGCAICTRLAEDIAHASDGWLTARSLRDPEVQTLLDAARPDWRWEPTLLEVRDGRPHVFTGVAMRARMALGLGPRRAWRVLALVYHIEPPASTFTSERRTFLRRGAAVLAGLLFMPPLDTSLSNANKLRDESPIRLEPVPPGSEVIALLQQTGAVQNASQHSFGQPDWGSVYQITHTTNPLKGYMIQYIPTHVAKSSGSDPDATFLFVGDPIAQKGNIGFVIQTSRSDANELVLTWLTTDAQVVKTTVLQNGQVVRESVQLQSMQSSAVKSEQAPRASTLQQQSFTTCFLACLNTPITPGCLSICVVCGGAPFPANPACITCVGCAGGIALYCAYQCS